jgi:hypothetical protein
MKSQAQLLASIDRFQRVFWNRESGRPPVGIAPDRVWSPLGFLREPLRQAHLAPADVTRAVARTDYEDCAPSRRVLSDDWMPFSAAWRAVPWLEAMCGCPVHTAGGSLAPDPAVASLEALATASIPAREDWFERLRASTAEIAATLPEDCWLSPSILRGCADVLAAMRGINNFCLDLHDDPALLRSAAARVNALHARVLEMHFGLVQPKLGGYGHIFGYWAPGPTTVLQEDAMGLCAPAIFRDLFQSHTAELVRRFGPYVLFHLHSTGFRHYRYVLDIPGIAGLELTVEANGPRLAAMVPALREILERSRLILMVDAHFEDLPAALRALPHEGLYVLISDRFIPDEPSFRAFLAASFNA